MVPLLGASAITRPLEGETGGWCDKTRHIAGVGNKKDSGVAPLHRVVCGDHYCNGGDNQARPGSGVRLSPTVTCVCAGLGWLGWVWGGMIYEISGGYIPPSLRLCSSSQHCITPVRHPAPGQCMYLYPVLVSTLSWVASGPECRPAGPRVIMFQGTILIVTRD